MSTTEDETPDNDPLDSDPCGRVGLPWKLSRLRAKLSHKAKQEPKFRFYTLYDRIYRFDVLQAAYALVRKNNGSPGVDGVRFKDIEDAEGGVFQFLKDLQEELRSQRYQPQAVLRVYVPKPDGRQRPLGIPTIKDRVAQAATLLILEPIFEADFLDCSFGFRPGRSAHDALDAIRGHLAKGKRDVYDADLQGYFDSIPHDKLMKCVRMRIVDGKVLKLIRLWLTSAIEETDDRGRPTHRRPSAGTPQGGVISPLLANIYLHWFEVLFHRADGPANWAKAAIVRYADDFVVLAYYQGERLRKWIESTLQDRFGLTINREKTKVVKLNEVGGEPLEFLGFSLRYERSIWGTTSYLRVGPSRKTMGRFRDRLREMTSTRYCFMSALDVVSRVNRYLRGWSRYFGYGHPRRAFDEANYLTQTRMVSHLKRRSQRGNRSSQGRSFYAHLYDHLGLLRLCVNR